MSSERYEVEIFHKGIGDSKEELRRALVVEPGTMVIPRNPLLDLDFLQCGGYCRIGKEKISIPPDGEDLELTVQVRIVVRCRKEEVIKFEDEKPRPWYRRL